LLRTPTRFPRTSKWANDVKNWLTFTQNIVCFPITFIIITIIDFVYTEWLYSMVYNSGVQCDCAGKLWNNAQAEPLS
jgi:hypothetical protein